LLIWLCIAMGALGLLALGMLGSGIVLWLKGRRRTKV